MPSTIELPNLAPSMPLIASVRIALRDLLRPALMRVPLRYLLPVRDAYRTSAPGTPSRWAADALLELLRHRAVDLDHFAVDGEPRVLLGGGNSGIVRRVFWYGRKGYEQAELELWSCLCRRATNVLEIGANIGYFTIHGALAAPHASYTAVEPHPGSAAQLRRNLVLNGLTEVTVVEAAAVASSGIASIELFVPDNAGESTPTGAYMAGVDAFSRPSARSVTVAAVPADSIVGASDLIKVDAEGAEFDILSALRAHVESRRPVLLLEVLRGTDRLRMLLREWALDFDYRIHAVARGGLREVGPDEILGISLQDTHGTRDVLMVPAGTEMPPWPAQTRR